VLVDPSECAPLVVFFETGSAQSTTIEANGDFSFDSVRGSCVLTPIVQWSEFEFVTVRLARGSNEGAPVTPLAGVPFELGTIECTRSPLDCWMTGR
jgi:hypothetical protein